jgi:hypothetical protein
LTSIAGKIQRGGCDKAGAFDTANARGAKLSLNDYNTGLGFRFRLEAHGFDKGHALFRHDVARVECISDFGKMKRLDLRNRDLMHKNGRVF